MTREEAITELSDIRSDYNCFNENEEPKYHALSMAIEALKTESSPKFKRITIDTDGRWLNRKLDVFKDRLYLNEKTMIIYVPFVSFEAIVQRGGTIKRVGEEE